jgi:glutamine synthetase
VFVRQGVYTKSEAVARANIQLENYVKTMRIEALTMLDMTKREIYPAVNAYVGDLCSVLASKKAVFSSIPCGADEELIKRLASAGENMMQTAKKLEEDLANMPSDILESAKRMAHIVAPDMETLRAFADEAETLCSKEYWPFPTYTDILYSVK